ncbi:MAG: selenium cofactor biosynthesis protein YqeC [Candidatus Syntrophopropionicum ammoniitolerans]
MKIIEALGLSDREVVSFVGGGGKTSLMFRLSEEIPNSHRVIITTTTKIFRPANDKHPVVLLSNQAPVIEILQAAVGAGIRPILGLRLVSNNKIEGFGAEKLDQLISENYSMTDYVLIEADGSKGRSLKGYLDHEPVIPQFTTVLILVIGADAIGGILNDDTVHRLQIITRMTGLKPGTVMGAEDIAGLVRHPRGVLRTCPPTARIVAFINKMDLLVNRAAGYKLARLLLGGRISSVILGSAIGDNPVIDIIN